MRKADWVHSLWEGDGVAASAGRAVLLPFELAFGAVSELRGALYDAGVLATRPTAVPALSVGNLTVGGTGKTPLAAWFARRLRDGGAVPALVLRGYGDDEPVVHAQLNPDIAVVVSADRVAASENARRLGCDVVVLDDAFQHRRAGRVADVVVISADGWRDDRRRVLPAGPWRERLPAARRATLAVVTRKAASPEQAATVLETIARTAEIPAALVHLEMDDLVRHEDRAHEPLGELRGQSVLAISGIGDPFAFHAQLAARGATVTPAVFRDHHRFTDADVEALARAAVKCDRVICTLKDAVKLGPLWQGSTPLWYVSQRVEVERGDDLLHNAVAVTLAARSAPPRSGRPALPGPPD